MHKVTQLVGVRVCLGTQAGAFLHSLRQDPSAGLRHQAQSPLREGRSAPEQLFPRRRHKLARDFLISIRFRIKGPRLTSAQAALGQVSISRTARSLASKVGTPPWGLSDPHAVCFGSICRCSLPSPGQRWSNGAQGVTAKNRALVLHLGLTHMHLAPPELAP